MYLSLEEDFCLLTPLWEGIWPWARDFQTAASCQLLTVLPTTAFCLQLNWSGDLGWFFFPVSLGSEINSFGIWKCQDALTSSLHSLLGLVLWCVAKMMPRKAQDAPVQGVWANFREGGIVSVGWVCVFRALTYS